MSIKGTVDSTTMEAYKGIIIYRARQNQTKAVCFSLWSAIKFQFWPSKRKCFCPPDLETD